MRVIKNENGKRIISSSCLLPTVGMQNGTLISQTTAVTAFVTSAGTLTPTVTTFLFHHTKVTVSTNEIPEPACI